MPREVAHAFVATNALLKTKNLKDSIFDDKVLKSAFILGTFSPDSGYYLKSKKFQGDALSDLFHAVGEKNSFIHYKNLIEISDASQKSIIEAFSLGAISHILLDSFWHPLIFKVTGDYYDPDLIKRADARARHRRIESLIDSMIIKHKNLNPKNYLISNDIYSPHAARIESDFQKILGFKNSTLVNAWKWHKNLQRVFTNNIFSNFYTKLPIAKEFKALFSNFEKSNLDLVEEILTKHLSLNFETWIENSTNQLLDYFQKFEADKNSFFASTIGPSANSGVPGVNTYSGRYEIEERLLIGY